jgi:hypothetical protein
LARDRIEPTMQQQSSPAVAKYDGVVATPNG